MSKFRKDGALDERYKGAKEINQASSFLGSIFGIFSLLFNSWLIKKTQQDLEKEIFKIPGGKEEYERLLNLGKDEDGKKSKKE